MRTAITLTVHEKGSEDHDDWQVLPDACSPALLLYCEGCHSAPCCSGSLELPQSRYRESSRSQRTASSPAAYSTAGGLRREPQHAARS